MPSSTLYGRRPLYKPDLRPAFRHHTSDRPQRDRPATWRAAIGDLGVAALDATFAQRVIFAEYPPASGLLAGRDRTPVACRPGCRRGWPPNCCGMRHDGASGVSIGVKPNSAERWVAERPQSMSPKGDQYSARLTIDVTPGAKGAPQARCLWPRF